MASNTFRGLKLTARGVVVIVSVLLLVCVTVVWSSGVMNASASSAESVEVVSYVVRPGDTWWSIAEPLTNPGDDLRDTVYLLMDLNEHDSAGLQAGQTVLLPK